MTIDLPWVIGISTLTILTLATLSALGVSLRLWRKRRGAYDSDGPAITAIISGVAAPLFIAATIATAIPFDMDYHQYRTVRGTVTDVGKRLIAEGKSMSERYVVVIDGNPYGVDDTRASLLKVGDKVALSCKREWQWAADSGWACNWGVQP